MLHHPLENDLAPQKILKAPQRQLAQPVLHRRYRWLDSGPKDIRERLSPLILFLNTPNPA